jgi:hypothetical protein
MAALKKIEFTVGDMHEVLVYLMDLEVLPRTGFEIAIERDQKTGVL